MKVLVRGCGVVGTRAARLIVTLPGVDSLILDDPRTDHVIAVARSLGERASTLSAHEDWRSIGAEIVVLASPPRHVDDAYMAISSGANVVSTSDSFDDVEDLLALDEFAKSKQRVLVVGAGFAPGLSCVLARHGASEFASASDVEEIHVAKVGTAGPACARQHHLALQTPGRDWRDREWVEVQGGSGRELCWFPDPIAGADCYRAALPDTLLLQQAFPAASRITARMSATRRDRLTSRLPMLRKPHDEAGDGAIRVELRGLRDNRFEVVVLGSMSRPSVAAAAVISVAVGDVLSGRYVPGSCGLANRVNPVAFLQQLADHGVNCARFEGAPSHL